LWLLACVTVCAADGGDGGPEALQLVRNGRSYYQIVIPREPSFDEERAAQELAAVIRQISGAELRIVADNHAFAKREIIIGRNRHTERAGVAIDYDRLGREGFTLRTVGERLIIAGGPDRGVLYGVYALLEDYMGCRWFAPRVVRIPSPSIEITAIVRYSGPPRSQGPIFCQLRPNATRPSAVGMT